MEIYQTTLFPGPLEEYLKLCKQCKILMTYNDNHKCNHCNEIKTKKQEL